MRDYTAKRVGKVVPLDQFASANFLGERTKIPITAVGNASTGSPTFTAFIAENRNVFSWHDKLEDLRQPNAEGSVPEGTTLSLPANRLVSNSGTRSAGVTGCESDREARQRRQACLVC